MFMMPGVPGGYDKQLRKHYFVMESAFWNTPCRGKAVHDICIVVAEDLASIVKQERHHLFHNKYFMEYDHSVMKCMEERIAEKNKLEYQVDKYILNQTTHS